MIYVRTCSVMRLINNNNNNKANKNMQPMQPMQVTTVIAQRDETSDWIAGAVAGFCFGPCGIIGYACCPSNGFLMGFLAGNGINFAIIGIIFLYIFVNIDACPDNMYYYYGVCSPVK